MDKEALREEHEALKQISRECGHELNTTLASFGYSKLQSQIAELMADYIETFFPKDGVAIKGKDGQWIKIKSVKDGYANTDCEDNQIPIACWCESELSTLCYAVRELANPQYKQKQMHQTLNAMSMFARAKTKS